MPGACGTIGLALTVLYVAYMAAMAHEMAYPRACKGHGCYQALLTDQRVDLRLVVGGAEVCQALNVSADEQLDFKVELPVPPEVRRGTDGIQSEKMEGVSAEGAHVSSRIGCCFAPSVRKASEM